MSQTFNGQPGGMIASLLPQQQQMVYGLDGTAYPSADAARAAGVFDFRYAPPMPQVPTSMPAAMPMAQAEGLPFAMPAARGSFNPLALRGSGLLSDLPAGAESTAPKYPQAWNVPDYFAPAAVQAYQMAGGGRTSSPTLSSNPGWDRMSSAEKAAFYRDNPTLAAITQMGQDFFGTTKLGLMQAALTPDFVADQRTISRGYDPFSSDPTSADSVAAALSRAGYSDLGGYNDSAPDMSDFRSSSGSGGSGGSGGGGNWSSSSNYSGGNRFTRSDVGSGDSI